MKFARIVLLLVLLPSLPLGCRNPSAVFSPPGTMRQQQLNATLHDPYTETDVGPDVVGGRPREYQKPLAEPVRSRFVWDNWMGR